MTEEKAADPLVASARAGDARAFSELAGRCGLGLSLYARRAGRALPGATFDPDDVVQVTLEKAWRLLPRFELRGPGSFDRWLRALARGVIADRMKHDRRGAGVRHVESVVGDATALPSGATTASESAARRETLDHVEAALTDLPTAERVVVERHVLDACSLAEIGRELSLSKNAVFERLHRGLRRLRSALGTDLWSPGGSGA